jgi:hypothetical protein
MYTYAYDIQQKNKNSIFIWCRGVNGYNWVGFEYIIISNSIMIF